MVPLKKIHRILGFSLVEVVLALGLASFALVSMVGLLSVGFRGARDSINMTVISDIADGVAGEAQLTAWTNLTTNYGNSTWYYDDLGKKLSNKVQAAYEVRTSLTTAPTVISAGNFATNLQIEIHAVANPQNTNIISRLLVKSE